MTVMIRRSLAMPPLIVELIRRGPQDDGQSL